ncbi:Rix1 complex component [Polychytrium aggregatum]|uniref:Rix1 complex component n=1 Tax=Polychytrium aggregatum TaxID=110093 RepID=UPI0022FF0AC8|nr:Rix1 complex component [Polychytrium aggregatum]KAI9197118.1 Rix1 complex component [Polychytrium aggregatum]
MPKATRKKKLKEEDFRKTKLKVGKSKPQASNATDVSFKARYIHVPTQTIVEDKSNVSYLNSKNQSLKDVLAQLRHYSAPNRREGILGLKDMLVKHPQILQLHFGMIIEAAIRLMVDEDDEVRKNMLVFSQFLVSTSSREQFRPFIALIMAFTCSSITHIMEDIRLDALKFLNCWMERYPDLVVQFSDKVIPNYISLLTSASSSSVKSAGASAPGRAGLVHINPKSQLGSNKSRVDVLASLYTFLRNALRIDDSFGWFLSNNGVNVERILSAPGGRVTAWTAQSLGVQILKYQDPQSIGDSKLDFISAGGSFANAADRLTMTKTQGATAVVDMNTIQNEYNLTDPDQLKAFISVIMPVLVDFWLESTPICFGSGTVTQSPALSVMHIVLKTLDLLWRSLLVGLSASVERAWVEPWFKSLTKHFMCHFPFGEVNCTGRDSKATATLTDMNIIFCELLSHFMFVESVELMDKPSKSKLLNYLLLTFGYNPDAMDEDDQMIPDLKQSHLEATYPLLWTLLNRLDVAHQGRLLDVFLDYYKGTNVSSQSKKSAFRLTATITLLQHHRQYTGRFRISASDSIQTTILSFILSIPKLLWELKTTDEEFTRMGLEFLAKCLRENVAGICDSAETLDSLQKWIVPFLWTSSSQNASIYGPFVKLSEQSQLMTLDFLCYLPQWSEKLIRAIVQCGCATSASTLAVERILEIFDYRQRQGAAETPTLSIEVFTSVLVTVGIVGYTHSELERLESTGKTPEQIYSLDAGYAAKRASTEKKKQTPKAEIALSSEEEASIWARRCSILETVFTMKSHQFLATVLGPVLGKILSGHIPIDALFSITRVATEFGPRHGDSGAAWKVLHQQLPLALVHAVSLCYRRGLDDVSNITFTSIKAALHKWIDKHPESVASLLESAATLANNQRSELGSYLSFLKLATRILIPIPGARLVERMPSESRPGMIERLEKLTSMTKTLMATDPLKAQVLEKELEVLEREILFSEMSQ